MIGNPWNFANLKILYMYFKCVFIILLYCFMLLICDTKINNNNNNKMHMNMYVHVFINRLGVIKVCSIFYLMFVRILKREWFHFDFRQRVN